MPTGTIPTILLIAVVVNLVIMAWLLASVRRRRVHGEQMLAQLGLPGAREAADEIEPATRGIGIDAAGGAPIGDEAADLARTAGPEVVDEQRMRRAAQPETERNPEAGETTAITEATGDDSEPMSDTQPSRTRRFALPDHEDHRATESIEAFIAGGRRPPASRALPRGDIGTADVPADLDPFRDPTTGLDTPIVWRRLIADEGARAGRYHRPVSIVIAELDGLDRLVERLGSDVAERLLKPIADSFRSNGRTTDRVARLGPSRFGVLLPETDEIQAINYVERVRVQCDRWLASGAIAARLSLGWASPTREADLAETVVRAEERMQTEQQRPAPWLRHQKRGNGADEDPPNAPSTGGSTSAGSQPAGKPPNPGLSTSKVAFEG